MADLDKYKQAIVDTYRKTNKNIFVNATAGSGKTFTLCKLAEITPPIKSSIFLAFNKSIAQELEKRLPRNVKSATLHSCALSSLHKAFKFNFNLSDTKNFYLLKDNVDFGKTHPKRIPGIIMKVCRLYDLMRYNIVEDNVEHIIELGERYGEEVDEDLATKAIELRRLNLERADKFFLHGCKGKINMDFTDMLYYAVRYVEPKDIKQYNVVMVDECLPYHIPVMCENNQHIPIGEIVEKRLPIKVLTFNHETGKQEYKRVTNYSKTFNVRRTIKINVKDFRGKRGAFLTCTDNHKIWVKDKGYVKASDIQIGDVVQIETSAKRTEMYRVTPKGKQTLSKIMGSKNKDKNYRSKIDYDRINPQYKVKGGNGKRNDLQEFFISKLNPCDEWEMEGVVVPGKYLVNKYNSPNHYKVDILSRKLNIAIELDGCSHKRPKRMEQDKRKKLCLEELGYKVIHIENENLLRRFDEIIDAVNNHHFDFCFNGIDCPTYMRVVALTEMELKEKYVYDITVEDNHNFYANGFLVHNCQDLSLLQYELIKKLKTPRGRLIGVGDERQAIYGFQGSNLDTLNTIKTAPNTIALPLNMTYRCAETIVEEANKVFPNSIEAAPGAKKGEIVNGSIKEAQNGDFILCRNNAPLVDTFIYLLRQGKKCSILGKEYGDSLVGMIDSVDDIYDFEAILLKMEEKLRNKGIKNPQNNEAYCNLEDKVNVLISLFDYFGSLEKVRSVIYDVFMENPSQGITLSTIHKSKGLEANRIFFLQPELLPSKYATTELELYAEKCLKFVAITRAKDRLIYC